MLRAARPCTNVYHRHFYRVTCAISELARPDRPETTEFPLRSLPCLVQLFIFLVSLFFGFEVGIYGTELLRRLGVQGRPKDNRLGYISTNAHRDWGRTL